jgi:checkpoint serine/threonine-protein kinase
MQSSKKVFLPKHLAKSTSGKIDNYQCVKNPKTGRLECVFVNLEAVYSQAKDSKSEYSFEELRARHRGWTDRQWSRECSAAKGGSQITSSPDIALDHHDEQAETVERPAKGFKIHLDEDPAPKPKQRGFKIFEDVSSEPGPSANAPQQNKVIVETSSKTLALNDENDENAAPAQPTEAEIRKKMRREERANRTRKIQVMDVKHIKNETKTVQLNLDSPTGQKPKRKKNVDRTAEPTMTINTKEAMDEIYDIFNAPLASQAEQSEESESEASDSDEEDDYTTGDESTATGKLSAAPSDYGDETRNELLAQAPAEDDDEDEPTEHTGWSDFTTSKHVPREDEDSAEGPATGTDRDWELYRDEDRQPDLPGDADDMVTPDEENVQTRSVPIASEDYRPPSAHFQQMTMLPNHRLPFMTPIAEQTESNLGTITARAQNDYFNNTKTPSRQASGAMPVLEDNDEDDEPPSSPFQEVTVDLNDDKFKVLQPIRTKSTKGNISLGQGTATSQIEAKTIAPSAPEAVQKGPIVLEQQCNPMDPYLRQTILSQIKPSLESFKGYHEHPNVASGRTAEIKKYIRSLAKAKNGTSQEKTAVPSPPVLQFEGSAATFTIKRELGAGTFAPVYLVENSEAAQAADDENSAAARGVGAVAHRKPLEAIKMEEPLSAWEFFILQQSHRRLGVSRAAESIVRAHEMHMFRDECFLIEEYRNQGTLLDLVNVARADSATRDCTSLSIPRPRIAARA